MIRIKANNKARMNQSKIQKNPRQQKKLVQRRS